MPTVDTSKYLMQMNEMKTERAPCRHRNARLKTLLLSTQSISSYLKLRLAIRRDRMAEQKPLTKVNWITLTVGFSPKSTLLT